MNHKELGNWGEDFACNILKKKGYTILNRNYFFKKLEIDIIAIINNFIVFIEVKTRFTDEFGEPWQSVNNKKQKQIIKVANQYITEYNLENESRFDVFSIIKNNSILKFEHIENAFLP